MKHILLIVVLSICAIAVKAQGVYYKPLIIKDGQSQLNVEPQVNTVRTTAYFEQNGEYYKMPIRVVVSESDTYNMENITVVSYYNDNGYGGGWRNLPYPANVTKCKSGFTYGSDLEKQFMYKANVQARTIYFDL